MIISFCFFLFHPLLSGRLFALSSFTKNRNDHCHTKEQINKVQINWKWRTCQKNIVSYNNCKWFAVVNLFSLVFLIPFSYSFNIICFVYNRPNCRPRLWSSISFYLFSFFCTYLASTCRVIIKRYTPLHY